MGLLGLIGTSSLRAQTDYSNQDLSGNNYRGHDLNGSTFYNTRLVGTSLWQANIEDWNFTDANLTDAAGTRSKNSNHKRNLRIFIPNGGPSDFNGREHFQVSFDGALIGPLWDANFTAVI